MLLMLMLLGTRKSVHVSLRLPQLAGPRLQFTGRPHVRRLRALCRPYTCSSRGLESLQQLPLASSAAGNRPRLLASTGYGRRNDRSAPGRRTPSLQLTEVGRLQQQLAGLHGRLDQVSCLTPHWDTADIFISYCVVFAFRTWTNSSKCLTHFMFLQ